MTLVRNMQQKKQIKKEKNYCRGATVGWDQIFTVLGFLSSKPTVYVFNKKFLKIIFET